MGFVGPSPLGSLTTAADAQAEATRVERLAAGRQGGPSERDGLLKVAREFEGVFLNTLMKAMRKTVPENKLFNSQGATKYYQQMQDAEMAKAMATGTSGMGIADLIVRQFDSTVSGDPAAVSAEPEIVPHHPAVGPPAPVALQRYRQFAEVDEKTAAMTRLRRSARSQEPAVADTLARLDTEIDRASRRTDMDPALLLAVIMEESGGDAQARSPKGAVGLMQLMPETAREVGVSDPTQPAENLLGGARYLSRMMEKYDGRLDLALAAYNAGPGTVDRAGGRIPDYRETRRYVQRVMARYSDLTGGTNLANETP